MSSFVQGLSIEGQLQMAVHCSHIHPETSQMIYITVTGPNRTPFKCHTSPRIIAGHPVYLASGERSTLPRLATVAFLPASLPEQISKILRRGNKKRSTLEWLGMEITLTFVVHIGRKVSAKWQVQNADLHLSLIWKHSSMFLFCHGIFWTRYTHTAGQK